MKYLLIDGNNLAIRAAFANDGLTNSDGVPTGVHYGVFQSLLSLKQQFKEYQMLVVWDGKSKRRIEEAKAGVKRGLIRSGYKENRKKDDQPQALLNFYAQAPYLQKGIGQTGIPQIRLSDYETDDVIASYCKTLRDDNKIVVVTSDKDYYQLLHDNVELWDGMKQKMTTKEEWEKEFKITPDQYLDCEALSGDAGDNIFGVPAWGDKGSLKAIQQFGSWAKVIEEYKNQYGSLRDKYPDLKDNETEFKKLQRIVTKSGKPKYPEITIEMPFTGVTLAVEEKKVKAITKTVLLALMFEERVRLAYSLKKMDDEIPDLPEITSYKYNEKRLQEYFDYFNIDSLKDEVWILSKKF